MHSVKSSSSDSSARRVASARPLFLVGLATLSVHCGLLAGLEDWRLAEGSGDAAVDGGSVQPNHDASTDLDAGSSKDSGSDVATPIDGPTPTRCNSQTPFGSLSLLANLISPSNDSFARFSADELTVYFETDRNGGSGKIFQATRASLSAQFSAPIPVPELELADVAEGAPALTPDGLNMLFQTIDGSSARQIWIASRAATSSPFGTASALGSLLAPAQHPYALVPDLAGQVRFLFAVGQPDNGPFLVHEATIPFAGGAPVQKPVLIQNMPANGFEAPVLAVDGTEFFGSSQNAIWHAVRAGASGPFSTPSVISELNDPSYKDMPDFISADACRLYFHRGSATNFNELFVATRPGP